MTVTPSILYWLTRLDNINTAFGLLASLGGFAFVFSAFFYIMTKCDAVCDEMSKKVASTAFKIITPLWLLGVVGTIFTPTSKEMAMIYVVPHIAESQVIKQDIPELYDMGVAALKDWLKSEQKDAK